MTRSNCRQQGFTLIEVLIALTIFTIGVLAVASLQTASIRYNSAAKLSSDGVFKAERKVEELLAGNYDVLVSDDQVSGPHTLSWRVTDQGSHKTIALTVTWTDSNGNKSFVLNSIKGNF